jgi:hypothetical protein
MSQAVLDPQEAAKLRRRKVIVSVIVASIALHFIGAILAGIWIVARYLLPTPATFEVKKEIRIAAEERQHRMNMDEFDALKPKPTFQDKMSTARPTEFSLPDLPAMPLDALSAINPSDIVSDQLDSLSAAAGDGSGSGTGGGRGGSISFLGVTSTGTRVLLLFDISTTVTKAVDRAGLPMEKIRDKVAELIDSLSINTTFGMVQFARNYAFFDKELLPASDPNRAKAKTWLNEWFTTSGSLSPKTPNSVRGSPGFLVMLEEAFKMKPDLIFILSDGGFYRGGGGGSKGERIPYDEINRKLRELQETLPQPANINFIGVGMRKENLKDMKSIIRSRGGNGKFRELEN